MAPARGRRPFLSAEGGEADIRLRGFSPQATGDIFVDGLRGSASMLFGRGSTGGAVNQASKLPRLSQASEVPLTLGSLPLPLHPAWAAAPDGPLVVANGGIVRDPQGRKIPAWRMDSSLVRLDGRSPLAPDNHAVRLMST